MEANHRIEKSLKMFRWKLVRHAFLESVLLTLVCGALWGLLLALTGPFLPDGPLRPWIAGGGWIALTSASFYQRFVRCAWTLQDLGRVALLIEERIAHTENLIVAGWEWGGNTRSQSIEAGYSADLITGILQQANQVLDETPTSDVIDFRSAKRLGRMLIAVGLVWGGAWAITSGGLTNGILAWTSPSYEEPGLASLVAPVTEVDLLIEDISVELTHPVYSKLPPREIEGSTGDIAAMPGTSVVLRGKQARSFDSGLLRLEDGTQVPLLMGADGAVEARWILLQGGPYSIEALDGEQSLRERTPRILDLLPDHSPTVKLLSPEEDREVNLEDQVKLIFTATDDFGLAKVELLVQNFSGGEPLRILAQRLDGERLFRGSTTFDIRDANPEPGDTLEVSVVAFDQDTVQGPKSGASQSIQLKVWSPQEKHDEIVDAIAGLMDTLLDLLADRLESPLDAQNRKSWTLGMETASTTLLKTERLLLTLEGILLEAREDTLMPVEVVDRLKEIRVRHQENTVAESQHLQRLVKKRFGLNGEEMKLLSVHNEEHIVALETDILVIEDLVVRLRQDKVLDQAKDLMTQQNELMRLLDALKESGNLETRDQAEAVVDRLQQQLNEMMAEMAKQMQRLPQENFNAGALDPKGAQADMKSYQSELEAIREMLAKGDFEGAQKAAEALQQRIAEMMANMEAGFEGMRVAGQSTEAQEQLQEVEKRLAELAQEERRILNDTNSINEKIREALEASRKEKLDTFLQEQRDRVSQMRQALSEVPEDPLGVREQERLNEIKDAVRRLEERLTKEDLDRSDEHAERVAGECNGLGREVSELEERSDDRRAVKSLKQGGERLEITRELAEQMAKDIRELNPEPGEFLSSEDENSLRQLQKDQKANRKELAELESQMKNMKEAAPALKGAFSKLLRDADDSMKRAEQSLGKKKPQEAASREEAALDKLGRAQKRIQRMMQPGQGPGSRQAGHRDEETGIPDPEDYAVPAEFRKEVLRAMKGNAPSEYKEQIDTYYQELIR